MYALWVKESTTTIGQGDLTLSGPLASFAPFSSQYKDGDSVLYSIEDGMDREMGIGVYHAGNTISRNQVLAVLVNGNYQDNPTNRLNLSGNAKVACTDDKQLLNWAVTLRQNTAKDGWVPVVDPADGILKLSQIVDPGTY